MKNAWLARVLCLVAAAGLMLTACGCSMTPEAKRRRALVIEDDLRHLRNDAEWILFMERASFGYDEMMVD